MPQDVTNLPVVVRRRKNDPPAFAPVRLAQIAIERMYNRPSADYCDQELMDYILHVGDEAIREAKIYTIEDACAALKMFCSNSDYLDMYPEVLERVLRWLQQHAKPAVKLLAPPG